LETHISEKRWDIYKAGVYPDLYDLRNSKHWGWPPPLFFYVLLFAAVPSILDLVKHYSDMLGATRVPSRVHEYRMEVLEERAHKVIDEYTLEGDLYVE
jgi:hypothetical protein